MEEPQSNQLAQRPSPTTSAAGRGPDQDYGAEGAGALLPAPSSPSCRGVSCASTGASPGLRV